MEIYLQFLNWQKSLIKGIPCIYKLDGFCQKQRQKSLIILSRVNPLSNCFCVLWNPRITRRDCTDTTGEASPAFILSYRLIIYKFCYVISGSRLRSTQIMGEQQCWGIIYFYISLFFYRSVLLFSICSDLQNLISRIGGFNFDSSQHFLYYK